VPAVSPARHDVPGRRPAAAARPDAFEPPGYRPDIDGLRAVAVAGVIVYHAFPHRLPGGFCGVDVFFVVSGFVLTRMVARDVVGGRFSLAHFYARRIRRLFPALAAALTTCLALGAVGLLPTEFALLGRHTTASVLFAENVLLHRTGDYFAPAAASTPLLHLWSLAVEEQLYVVFPFVVLLVIRASGRCAGEARSARSTAAILAAAFATLAGASFAANLVASTRDPSADFYLTEHRAWEFLAGAVLACADARRGATRAGSRATAASVCGIVLLLGSMACLHGDAPYPGWRAALPVTATLLLVGAGGGTWIGRAILSNRLAVRVGLLSYPLYLFHWPLLAFAHMVDGRRPPLADLYGALAASVALAVLTHRFIEGRIRRNPSPWTVPLLVASLVVIGVAGTAAALGALPVRNDGPAIRQVVDAIRDDTRAALASRVTADAALLRIGGDGPKTLFYGDSMAPQYVPRLLALLDGAPAGGRGALVVGAPGTPPIPGVTSPSRPGAEQVARRFRDVLDTHPEVDRVVLLALWHFYLSPHERYAIDGRRLSEPDGRQRALERLAALFAELAARGKRVTVVLASPGDPRLAPEAFLRRGFGSITPVTPPPVTVANFLANHPALAEFQGALAAIARRDGADVVDPLRFLCPDGVCVAADGDGPIRYDQNHLRATFVRDHVRYLDETVAP